MQSSLILNDLTCVDHAYIDSNGLIVGGSFHPTVILTGEVTDDEHVVIDFSKCKKLVKSLIDDHFTGFDHKLWIMSDSKANVYIHPKKFEIATGPVTITTDQHALRSLGCNYDPKEIGKVMARYLEENIFEAMQQKIKVEVLINTNFHALHSGVGAFPFRYAHGLKDSSSFGCQNIAHGHLSYIQALGEGYSAMSNPKLNEFMLTLANGLDETYFVAKKNIEHYSSNLLCMRYEACQRGEFTAVINTESQKVQIIDTETTIEHLIEYIKKECRDDLLSLGAKYLVVSEGLTKGSIVEL